MNASTPKFAVVFVVAVTLTSVVLFAVDGSSALGQQSHRGQGPESGESQKGNLLRLTAVMSTAADAGPQATQSQSPAPQSPVSPAQSPDVQGGIPLEIRRALYPGQRISKSITVTADPSTDGVPSAISPPPVHINPQTRTNYPTQPASHFEPLSADRSRFAPPRGSGFSQLPRTAADSSRVAAQNAAPSSGQSLASLLADSDAESKNPRPSASPNRRSESGDKESAVGLPAGLPVGSDRPSSAEFQALLQKIATSTAVVLFLGIGFILVAKRWLVGKETASTGGRSSVSDVNSPLRIQVVTRLKLNAKSNLHLVEVGDQRVLVASDLNGIQSVTALTPSFSETMGEYEEMPASESAIATASELTNESTASTANAASGTYNPGGRTIGGSSAFAQSLVSAVSAATNRSRGASAEVSGTSQNGGKNGGQAKQPKQSADEIEAEMKRQLAKLLGGEAFKDAFYKNTQNTRAVA